jgi:hypothetical protein
LVGVFVAVFVGVLVGVLVGVWVAVGVLVGVLVGVDVFVGVAVGQNGPLLTMMLAVYVPEKLGQSTSTSTRIRATFAGRVTTYVAVPLKPTGFGENTGSGRVIGSSKEPLVLESVSASVSTNVICFAASLLVPVMVTVQEPSAPTQGVDPCRVTW